MSKLILSIYWLTFTTLCVCAAKKYGSNIGEYAIHSLPVGGAYGTEEL